MNFYFFIGSIKADTETQFMIFLSDLYEEQRKVAPTKNIHQNCELRAAPILFSLFVLSLRRFNHFSYSVVYRLLLSYDVLELVTRNAQFFFSFWFLQNISTENNL